MTLRKGDVLIHKHETIGYFMVMEIKEKTTILSPLFGWSRIEYKEIKNFFLKCNYKPIGHTHWMMTVVKARYDHEYMRRINKL